MSFLLKLAWITHQLVVQQLWEKFEIISQFVNL